MPPLIGPGLEVSFSETAGNVASAAGISILLESARLARSEPMARMALTWRRSHFHASHAEHAEHVWFDVLTGIQHADWAAVHLAHQLARDHQRKVMTLQSCIYIQRNVSFLPLVPSDSLHYF